MEDRKARMRAAMNQCPSPVDVTIIARLMNSTMRAGRPGILRRAKNVSSKNIPIRNPPMFTTESVRVTIVPAISFAFGNANDLNTVKTDGATTLLKKIAAPSHNVNNTSRVKLIAGNLIPNQTHQLLPTVESLAE